MRSNWERGSATYAAGRGQPGKKTLYRFDTVGGGNAGEHGGRDLLRESRFQLRSVRRTRCTCEPQRFGGH